MSDQETRELRKVIYRAAGSLAVLLVFQIGIFLWWGGRMSARMDAAEGWINSIAARVHALEINDR